jgi:membrane peptidoglycan carboxypeptidase
MVNSVKDGEAFEYQWEGVPEPNMIDPEVMTKATYALQKVVEEGSGKPAQELLGPDGNPRPVAGKTGSTNGNMSAWFAGYIPQVSTVVGLYQSKPNDTGQAPITPFGEWAGGSLTGGTWPVWAWTEYMKKITGDMEVVDFPDYVPPLPSPSPTPTPSPSPTPTPDDKVEVPVGLVGQQYDGVAAVLYELGLNPQLVEVNSDQPAGMVLSVQHEGQEVNRGTGIRVEVSRGPAQEMARVPGGLVGGDENNARNQLRNAGLRPAIQYQASEDVEQGVVMQVNPTEGAEVPAGSPVQVIVSSGPGDIGFPTGEPTGGGPGNGGGGGGGG